MANGRYYRIIAAAVALTLVAGPAAAGDAARLSPALAGLGFLVGKWVSGDAKVADAGQTAKGTSTITAEAGGNVLLRRDHTDLYDAHGKPAGGFDQIMMIYPEAGAIRAEYSDGTHIIHYGSAEMVPRQSVVFTSTAVAGAPIYRLSYTLNGDDLAISFDIEPPGQTKFHPIATGTAHKSG